jgi:hypothetical protein
MTKPFALAFAALALSATVVSAQRDDALELGIDAGITIGLDDDAITVIGLPAESARLGFSIGRRTQLEPKAGFRILTGNGETVSTYHFELGLLYSLGSNRYPGAYHRAGMYLRPFFGILGFTDGDSDSAGYLGGGVGFKWPIVSRLSSRFEANYAHVFGENGADQIGILGGVSFFTR